MKSFAQQQGGRQCFVHWGVEWRRVGYSDAAPRALPDGEQGQGLNSVAQRVNSSNVVVAKQARGRHLSAASGIARLHISCGRRAAA